VREARNSHGASRSEVSGSLQKRARGRQGVLTPERPRVHPRRVPEGDVIELQFMESFLHVVALYLSSRLAPF
jgi:hypothetical protein